MAETEMITGYCPKCGKQLQIPADLEQFACMYCATKMKRGQLLPDAPTPVAPVEGDAQAEFEKFKANILSCITDFPDSYKHITKKEFSAYSDDYLAACRPIFLRLEQCARIEPDQADLWAVRGAEELMLQLHAWFEAQKGWERRYKRRDLIDSTKYTIALFLVPMLSRANLRISRPFVKKVHALWMQEHPESPFSLATYQDLVNGFRRKWFCFITSAICEAEGKPDDCAELTAFRAFRDGWLQQQPDGPALIEEYYDIAPAIVMHIAYCDDAPARYTELREQYLQPCYAALQAGQMQACKDRYVAMVRDMEQRYLKH